MIITSKLYVQCGKEQSYKMWPTSDCYHFMCFKELAVERGYLKIVSANNETR
jgi:hypothetical protein